MQSEKEEQRRSRNRGTAIGTSLTLAFPGSVLPAPPALPLPMSKGVMAPGLQPILNCGRAKSRGKRRVKDAELFGITKKAHFLFPQKLKINWE